MQEENVSSPGLSAKDISQNDIAPSITLVQKSLKSGKLKNVKQFLRRENLDLGYKERTSLWNSICEFHAKNQCSESFYSSLIEQDTTTSLDSLPDFVDPYFIDHYWLNAAGRRSASSIANAVALSHSHVLFAPLLYPTTAILLHYLPHPDSYRALCAILDSKKAYHLDQTPNGFSRSSLVLQRLTKRLSPKTYKWIEKSLLSEIDQVSHFFLTWPLWIFRALPLSYLVRLFDNFLLDGVRALYRGCILILHLYSQYGGGGEDNGVTSDVSSQRDETSSSIASISPNLKRRRSFTSRLRNSIRKSFRATPKVKRKFEAAESMLDGIIVFVRTALPTLLTESQLITKAYAIRGISRKVLGKLSSCDAAELSRFSAYLPLRLSSNEITIYQVNLNTVNASVLYYLSELKSTIITRPQMEAIWDHLPSRHTVVKPYIIFTSIEHGTSLRNFLHVVEEVEPLLMILRTDENEILGAFCSAAWGERHKGRKFFGTGETFVFTFRQSQPLRVYKWVGCGSESDTKLNAGQHLFQCAVDGIDVGCGSLHIFSDMNKGRTDVSATFNNEPLAKSKEFNIIEFEAIAFE